MNSVDIFNDAYNGIDARVQAVSAQSVTDEALRADVLRASLIFLVSAFDRFMHDFAVERLMCVLVSTQSLPSRMSNFRVGFDIACALHRNSGSGGCYSQAENALRQHLSWQSFQHPQKVSELLSGLFEGDVWGILSLALNTDSTTAKRTLELIVSRRDKIAHESDIRPESIPTGTIEKYPIDVTSVIDSMNFIQKLVYAIKSLA